MSGNKDTSEQARRRRRPTAFDRLPTGTRSEILRRLSEGVAASRVFRDLRLGEYGVTASNFLRIAKRLRLGAEKRAGRFSPLSVRGSRAAGSLAARKAVHLVSFLLEQEPTRMTLAILERGVEIVRPMVRGRQ